jgi:hypothetical protein
MDKNGFVFCQAPLIEEREISAVLEAAKAGKEDEPIEPIELDLFRVVVHNLGGLAGWKSVFDAVAEEWPANKIQSILKAYQYDFDNPRESIIYLDGARYILAPSPRPGIPRMMLEVNGQLPKNKEEIEELRLKHMATIGI